MSGIVENGLSIAVAGGMAYLMLSWLSDKAVMYYALLATMLP
jgi:hypothetical protein